MGKRGALVYGVIAYVIFFLTFLYLIGFVGDFLVPKTIDSGIGSETTEGLATAVAIDLLLLGIFAVQHSVMARPAFKRWWTRFVPEPIERSTYVWITSVILIVMALQWRPIGPVVWEVEQPAVRLLLQVLFFVGWITVLVSTFLIDHFDLFGLRQVYFYWSGKEDKPMDFQTIGLYNYTRHPLMLGFLIAFWATPRMSVGHLVFAITTTVYVLVAIQLEERDLIALFGDTYRDYKKRTSMLLPLSRSSRQ